MNGVKQSHLSPRNASVPQIRACIILAPSLACSLARLRRFMSYLRTFLALILLIGRHRRRRRGF